VADFQGDTLESHPCRRDFLSSKFVRTETSTHVCITIVPQFDINGDIIDVPRITSSLSNTRQKASSVCEEVGFSSGCLICGEASRICMSPSTATTVADANFRLRTWQPVYAFVSNLPGVVYPLNLGSLISHSLIKFTSSPHALRAEWISSSIHCVYIPHPLVHPVPSPLVAKCIMLELISPRWIFVHVGIVPFDDQSPSAHVGVTMPVAKYLEEFTSSYILHTRAFGAYLLGVYLSCNKELYGDGVLHVKRLKILYVMVILHVNMFHYFKIPYFTCTFFTKFIYNEYIEPYFIFYRALFYNFRQWTPRAKYPYLRCTSQIERQRHDRSRSESSCLLNCISWSPTTHAYNSPLWEALNPCSDRCRINLRSVKHWPRLWTVSIATDPSTNKIFMFPVHLSTNHVYITKLNVFVPFANPL
jgi:hypothetical protein